MWAIHLKERGIYNKRTLCIKKSVHLIFDEYGDIENLHDKEDFEIKELLQVQRDGVMDDLTISVSPENQVGVSMGRFG